MKVLDSGIDTLNVGYGVDMFHLDQGDLRDWKKSAQIERDSHGFPAEIYGRRFMMMPRGSKGYEYTLQNKELTLNLARFAENGQTMPEVYVRYSAELLAKNGLDGAERKVSAFISQIADTCYEKVSRADFRMDIEMEMPVIDLLRNVVTRSRTKAEHVLNLDTHIIGRKISGYTIGKGDMMCRIYDKTIEIEKTGKEYFKDIWKANGWKGGTVVRVEFQIRRNILKQFKIDTVQQLREAIPDLWEYCTRQWLRITEASEDTNVNRWKNTAFWQLVTDSVVRFGEVLGKLPERIRAVEYDMLFKQAMGCLKTCAAMITGKHDIEFVARLVREQVYKETKKLDWVLAARDRSYQFAGI